MLRIRRSPTSPKALARPQAASKFWLNHWQPIIPVFAFPAEIRKAICTTHAIELMNMSLKKVIKIIEFFQSMNLL